jgi:hypothetical protein
MDSSPRSMNKLHAQTIPEPMNWQMLQQVLSWLDPLLSRAIAAADKAYGSGAAISGFRGLYLSEEDTARLLERQPGEPFLFSDVAPYSLERNSCLAWLEDVFDLDQFDIQVLLICLAPEIDLRYGRLYAYLQDDINRAYASVDLALNMLCPTPQDKISQRSHFSPQAPLFRHHLLHLIPDPDPFGRHLLQNILRIDELVVRFMIGPAGLDSRLSRFCELEGFDRQSPTAYLDNGVKNVLRFHAHRWHKTGCPLHLYFQGKSEYDRRQAAKMMAFELKTSLLTADIAKMLSGTDNFELTFQVLFRCSWFMQAVLNIEAVDRLFDIEQTACLRKLVQEVARFPGVVILSGNKEWQPIAGFISAIVPVAFPHVNIHLRRQCWQDNLRRNKIRLEPEEIDQVASRFYLTPAQIGEAATQLAASATPAPGLADVYAAARGQSANVLGALAEKIIPRYTWNDLVLPQDEQNQLKEICQRVACRNLVLEEWGFGQKHSSGRGVSALFYGVSGTGKTMAAEIIAGQLGLDLYRIDLANVVSKYIGETEKNLDLIFRAAEDANVILFFDEAEALFGKRSEVHDAHDRYANIEIAYLLQKMDTYEGVALLASNLAENLDDAFKRRLAFSIYFPFPDEVSRQRIWQGVFPEGTPLDQDVDLNGLARRFKLSGGSIKNIAVAASYLAAADGRVVRKTHLRRAVRREFQKMGKLQAEEELVW